MCVVKVENFIARCEARGVSREVSLFLLPEGSVALLAGDEMRIDSVDLSERETADV
jgi:hypothetical protein